VIANRDQKTVCQHKPGEPWADGCCTSQHRSTETVVEELHDQDSESVLPQLSGVETENDQELPKELAELISELEEEQDTAQT
jgi:hypothetical protein